jgi:hypothetical protein
MPTRRDFLTTTAVALSSPSLLGTARAHQRSAAAVEVFADFEAGNYEGWTLEGNCWGLSPASEQTYAGRVSGFGGKRFLSTLHPLIGTNAVGRALSREFRIERPFVDFLIAGGHYPDEACLNLRVEGVVEFTATGDDTGDFRSVRWDVSAFLGKQAQFEVVDSTRSAIRGYVMVDEIRLLDNPPFQELTPGQNAFFCFSKEDVVGREFQRLFSTPEGQGRRALIDWTVDRVTERLAVDLRLVDRADIRQCETLLRNTVDHILRRYAVRDALTKQLIAANACAALAALLTDYDDDLADFVSKRAGKDAIAYDYAVRMRDPVVVLRRGKAVCSGIAALEQRLAVSLQDLGVECVVANGHTRHADNTPYTEINHSWSVYSFADRSLWAPSDTTHAIGVMKAAHKLPTRKLVRSSMLLIDPLLRDTYALFHFVRNCRVGHPGKDVPERVVNLIPQQEWADFHEKHPYLLKSARITLAQLDKEDAARLA